MSNYYDKKPARKCRFYEMPIVRVVFAALVTALLFVVIISLILTFMFGV